MMVEGQKDKLHRIKNMFRGAWTFNWDNPEAQGPFDYPEPDLADPENYQTINLRCGATGKIVIARVPVGSCIPVPPGVCGNLQPFNVLVRGRNGYSRCLDYLLKNHIMEKLRQMEELNKEHQHNEGWYIDKAQNAQTGLMDASSENAKKFKVKTDQEQQ
jgi:hypothetical protein